MIPAQITASSFDQYPPQARAVAVQSLHTLQQLPLVFAVLLLREIRAYDWQFPAERRVIDDQLRWLASLSSTELHRQLARFYRVSLDAKLSRNDWIIHPQPFLDGLTKQLWASGQIDDFRHAADEYAKLWRAAMPEPAPAMPRLSIVIFGSDVHAANYPLFRKMRPHGIFFPAVDTLNAWPTIAAAVSERTKNHPTPFLHWYIDGGDPRSLDNEHIARMSWSNTAQIRSAILERIHQAVQSGYGGPEALRTQLAETNMKQLGLPSHDGDDIMDRFRVNVLTMGSGTQIFSTTFVQWSAREALRRAQPCTLLLRYAARQRALPMNELLSNAALHNQVDPEGSLMDADIGAYYTWIDQQRLTGQETSVFLALSEDRKQAMAIGPTLPRGTTAVSTLNMQQLLSQIT